MNKYILTLFLAVATLTSCTKDDPTPEVDQEELGSASLTFTAVNKVDNNGTITYTPIVGEAANEIKFTGATLLPPVGAHLHLHVGETYKMELKSYDFAGRESQETFLQRADTHQAFLLGAPAQSMEFVYGDNQVGVTAYITILEKTESITLRYIMRHLNAGVKARITAADWNNTNFTQFTGANDLDLKFEAHLTEEHDSDH